MTDVAPCPTCTRPIDDPQTCTDCGKVTCTDCAVYSEDGETAWCDDCGEALIEAAERTAAPYLAQQVDGLREVLAAVKADRDRLRDALGFYANQDNYCELSPGTGTCDREWTDNGECINWQHDMGRRARAALSVEEARA